ncbi:MAG: cell division protein ZapD [Rhodocyclaceae bacterium]|nr:cell division protein ZapD [Rhodocyclaceae bacterium]MBL0077072.1 cell division protein ZapD [Rhodocyclaceae bacterium]MBP6109503.1 cell division protein ZapD [Rhodocyclaceae bacterium]MBP6279303.1 cell division protein ZapD [Rhodocyclaceae bacterium]
MITYEYPLSERVRTLLRLEDLFDKVTYFANQEHPMEHHVALNILFEILEVASRADLKFDLVQELERQRQILLSFRNNPDISEDALNGALYEIEQASTVLLSMHGKIGHYLRENEWLMAIKNRAGIPGGVCEFDLPGYHHWLHKDSVLRRHDIDVWLKPMLSIRAALAIVLRLLRASGRPERLNASKGAFQLMLGGRNAQLVRLRLDASDSVVPEISAGKFAINIRFLAADMEQRPKQVDAEIAFEMTLCNL